MKRFLILLTLASSCGPNTPIIVDDALAPYVHKFEKDIDVRVSNVSVGFGPTSGNVVGKCLLHGSYRKITIKKDYWDSVSEVQKEQLMYHELGHCALGLGHEDGLLSNYCPASIMYPFAFEYCYKNFPEYYKKELKLRVLNSRSAYKVDKL